MFVYDYQGKCERDRLQEEGRQEILMKRADKLARDLTKKEAEVWVEAGPEPDVYAVPVVGLRYQIETSLVQNLVDRNLLVRFAKNRSWEKWRLVKVVPSAEAKRVTAARKACDAQSALVSKLLKEHNDFEAYQQAVKRQWELSDKVTQAEELLQAKQK